MGLVGESGTAVRGEVGREEMEPLSDMEREVYSAQGDMDVTSTRYQGVIDTRTASVDNPSSLSTHDERDPNSASAQGFLRSLPSLHTPSHPD